MGSALWILFLHSALFRPAFPENVVISSPSLLLHPICHFWITSTPLSFYMYQIILRSGASHSLHCRYQNHLSHPLNLFSIYATSTFTWMISFLILSFLVLPHIHLNILISTTLILCKVTKKSSIKATLLSSTVGFQMRKKYWLCTSLLAIKVALFCNKVYVELNWQKVDRCHTNQIHEVHH